MNDFTRAGSVEIHNHSSVPQEGEGVSLHMLCEALGAGETRALHAWHRPSHVKAIRTLMRTRDSVRPSVRNTDADGGLV